MRLFARTVIATAALALVGGAGLAATSTSASAQDVRIQVGTPTPYSRYYQSQRPVYKYRPATRYYHQTPRRRYKAPRRNVMKCRWVPHRGRVCW